MQSNSNRRGNRLMNISLNLIRKMLHTHTQIRICSGNNWIWPKMKSQNSGATNSTEIKIVMLVRYMCLPMHYFVDSTSDFSVIFQWFFSQSISFRVSPQNVCGKYDLHEGFNWMKIKPQNILILKSRFRLFSLQFFMGYVCADMD